MKKKTIKIDPKNEVIIGVTEKIADMIIPDQDQNNEQRQSIGDFKLYVLSLLDTYIPNKSGIEKQNIADKCFNLVEHIKLHIEDTINNKNKKMYFVEDIISAKMYISKSVRRLLTSELKSKKITKYDKLTSDIVECAKDFVLSDDVLSDNVIKEYITSIVRESKINIKLDKLNKLINDCVDEIIEIKKRYVAKIGNDKKDTDTLDDIAINEAYIDMIHHDIPVLEKLIKKRLFSRGVKN